MLLIQEHNKSNLLRIIQKKQIKVQFFNLSLYDKDTENLWKNIFIDKDYDQISLFLDNLPVNSKNKVFQEIIFQILTSSKIFPKNRISDEQFSFIFNKIVDKLFITGRFNEIEFLYSKVPKTFQHKLCITEND